MAPRAIPSCVKAFRSLNIDQAWFLGFTEKGLEKPINDFIGTNDYDNFIIAPDDLIPSQSALDVVTDGLKRHMVFTGNCNMNTTNSRVNVRLSPVVGNHAFFMVTHRWPQISKAMERFKLFTFPLPEELPGGDFQTYFMGFAFTGMRRKLWKEFPFKTFSNLFNHNGNGSDYLVSERLRRKGYRMFSNRNAFFYHLNAKSHFIIGRIEPRIVHIKGPNHDHFPIEYEKILSTWGKYDCSN